MSSILENLQLACAVCKIGAYTLCRRLCCKKPPPPRPDLRVVCIGLNGSGKSTLIAHLCGETIEDEPEPTRGFLIKAVSFKDCILNTKEIGGGEKVRQFWKHYYKDSQGIIFVVNSACSTEYLETAEEVFHEALRHPQLQKLPCLVLANCQDKDGARTETQLREALDLDSLSSDRWVHLQLCSITQLEQARAGLNLLNQQLLGKAPEIEPDKQEINRV